MVSVLAHEFGHLLVARYFGHVPSSVLIGPFGGLTAYPSNTTARVRLGVAAAGPLANLATCFAFLSPTLIADPEFMHIGADAILDVNPLEPAWILNGSVLAVALKLVLWINGLLVLMNLLPAFPFDGGRIVRGCLGIAFPGVSGERIVTITFWVAVGVSSLLAATAAVMAANSGPLPFPTWLAFALLAAVTVIGATHDFVVTRDELVASAAPPQMRTTQQSSQAPSESDYASLEPHSDTPYLFETSDDDSADTWADTRATARPDAEVESEDDQILDEILTKLHAYGRDSLTEYECAFLQRVSARYRQRQKSS